MKEALDIQVKGIVQGVGFRPFVYRLANELRLGGSVRNTPEGVVIEVEGAPEAVAAFGERLPAEIPPLARLTRHERASLPPLGETVFHIGESAVGAGHDVLISPDVATCPDCSARSNPICYPVCWRRWASGLVEH